MTQPILDEAHIAELLELMEEEFPLLVSNFFQHAEEMVAKLKSMSEADSEEFILLIHSLKGSCRNMGGENLSELCESIERSARGSQLRQAQSRLDNVSSELEKLRSALDHHLSDLGLI